MDEPVQAHSMARCFNSPGSIKAFSVCAPLACWHGCSRVHWANKRRQERKTVACIPASMLYEVAYERLVCSPE